jgi:hypothetical protein
MPMKSVNCAARELLAALDQLDDEVCITPQMDALREAIETEDKAAQELRAQFTGQGQITSDPSVKYEIWN